VVNGTKILPSNNVLIYREKSNRNVRINSHNKRNSPTMPGLLPFMRYSTFKSPDNSQWPNDSFEKWFKARGPVLEAITVLSFRELAVALSPLPFQSAPSFPSRTVNPSGSVPLQSPLLQVQEQAEMANVPIDPEPFVPNGFEIVQVDGRKAVHRVVVVGMTSGVCKGRRYLPAGVPGISTALRQEDRLCPKGRLRLQPAGDSTEESQSRAKKTRFLQRLFHRKWPGPDKIERGEGRA
jgi:hypothetical protein